MAYPALKQKDVLEFVQDGFTPDQIAKRNQREMAKIDGLIDAMTLTRLGPRQHCVQELRLVLLGKTGSGKSAIGNLITGGKFFEESNHSESCTSTIELATCKVDDIHIQVIDTPGLCDTKKTAESILTEVAKVVDRFSDGIHGFLFVYNMGNPRFTKEQKKAFEQIQRGMFGNEFLDHCFVLLTHGNMLHNTTLTAWLDIERKKNSDFGNLVNNIVKQKVIAVENSEETEYGRPEQQVQIIRMIAANVKGVYTNDALNKYRADQEATAKRFQEIVKELGREIEAALSDELKSLPHNKIKDMDPEMETHIIDSTLVKVMQDDKVDPAMETQIRDALTIALPQKVKRLTSTSFLNMVENFAVGLLTAAGQILETVLNNLLETAVNGLLIAFLKAVLEE